LQNLPGNFLGGLAFNARGDKDGKELSIS